MSAEQAAAPPPTVHLHIGTTKSGTSFLQGVLWSHRVRLAADGILYPGEDRWAEQVAAVRDVLREGRKTRREIEVGAWEAMRDRMLGWPGRSVIMSMELISLATPERAERIVSSLHPADVHVVITARDLARVIPSSWQESVQNRQTWSWEEFVEGLTGSDQDTSKPAHRFWRQQDVPVIARTWANLVGTDHVHLVVVPRAGAPRDELWRRFAPVVGLDPDTYHAPPHLRGNPAVGAASAEFLRRLNVRLGRKFDIATYERHVKKHVAKETFGQLEDGDRLRLPAEHEAWAVARASEITLQILELGIDVHGDLDELIPELTPGDRPAVTIAEHEVADAGVQAVEALVRALAQPPEADPRRAQGAMAAGSDRERRRARRMARRAAATGDRSPADGHL